MAEIGRRLVHASGTAAPAAYLLGIVTWRQLGALLVVGCVVAFGLEIVRLRIGLDWWVYESLTREYEREKVAGYALYMVGMAVVALAFGPTIAVPAMLMLSIGDPVGGLLGSGDRGRKRPWVLAAMFVVCFALALPFLWLTIADPIFAVVVAALGAGVATVADGFTLSIRMYIVDDNLTIPVGAAVAMWGAFAVV